MLPMTINQQRTSKMSSVMNPEIQSIQKKYRNKKDQASMMKQQEEIQQVYDKYGTSMMGGCLPLLIQMPFLFALYPVIYNIEAYVPAIKTASDTVQRFLTIPNLKEAPAHMIRNSGGYSMPAAAVIITAILLPVLSGATQMLNIRLNQSVSGQQIDKDNQMAGGKHKNRSNKNQGYLASSEPNSPTIVSPRYSITPEKQDSDLKLSLIHI